MTKPRATVVEIPKPAPIPVRDERIASQFPLVDSIARALARTLPPCFELDDLRQAGYIGLIHAAERYQPSRKVPFRAYARRRITGAILDSVKRRNWQDATQEELEVEALNQLPSPGVPADETVRQMMDRTALVKAMGELEPAERQIIQLVVIGGETDRQAGRRFGVTKRTMFTRRKEALAKMRHHFEMRGRIAA